jgi:hypothetical protein
MCRSTNEAILPYFTYRTLVLCRGHRIGKSEAEICGIVDQKAQETLLEKAIHFIQSRRKVGKAAASPVIPVRTRPAR